MNNLDHSDDYKSIFIDLENNLEYQEAAEELEPGYQISRLRLLKDLSQSELAKLAGTSQSSIARLENGASPPSLSFLRRVAKALGAKVQVTFSDESVVTQDNECQENYLGWPGLSKTIKQLLAESNLGDEACALDERLFSQWFNQKMGRVFANIQDKKFSFAKTELKEILDQLTLFKSNSPIVSDFCFICENQVLIIDQLELMTIENQKLEKKSKVDVSQLFIGLDPVIVDDSDAVFYKTQESFSFKGSSISGYHESGN